MRNVLTQYVQHLTMSLCNCGEFREDHPQAVTAQHLEIVVTVGKLGQVLGIFLFIIPED